MEKAISFILVISAIVFVHELGHFLVAKFYGVYCHEFALGFGPRILKKKYGETLYSLRLFPLGGFVAMHGEEMEEDQEDQEGEVPGQEEHSSPRKGEIVFEKNVPRERWFSSKKPMQRIAILAAGPMMNFITAFIVILAAIYFQGHPTNTVGALVKDGPAAVHGMKVGDTIVEVNGTKIDSWEDVLKNVGDSDGKLDLKVDRGGEKVDVNISAKKDADGRVRIGVYSKPKKDASKTWGSATKTYKNFFTAIFSFLGNLNSKTATEISGPIGLYNIIGQVQSQGFLSLLLLVGYISVNVGILNILPIPAFDGGRIVLVIIEMIIRRPVGKKTEMFVNMAGFMFILTLIGFTFFNDISKLMGAN